MRHERKPTVSDASYPCAIAHASCLPPHASSLVPHPSCRAPHASCLVPHTSCLMPHASCLMPHASCLASCLVPPCHRLRGIVGDCSVASDIAQTLPIALTIRRPRHDFDVMRMKLIDEVAGHVAPSWEKPTRIQSLRVGRGI